MRINYVLLFVIVGCCLAIGAVAAVYARFAPKPTERMGNMFILRDDGVFMRADGTVVSKEEALAPHPQTTAEMKARRARQLQDQGTTVQPAGSAAGQDLELQSQIAAAFAEQNPVPTERLAYFQWCLSNPLVISVGWYGGILEVKEGQRGQLVEVAFAPRLMGTRTLTVFVPDYRVETWEYSGGKLTYVKGVGAGAQWHVMMGD